MIRVVIFAEGQTERKFIEEIIAPALDPAKIYLQPVLLKTSKDYSGGAVSFDRFKDNAIKTLKMPSAPILSTVLDLHRLHKRFPASDEAEGKANIHERVRHLEAALHQAIMEKLPHLHPECFIPHIQPFEFEGLLFSNVTALCATKPGWERFEKELTAIRKGYESPEHINGGDETHPSKRLERILPKYSKTRHGPDAAKTITLAVMERECAHFRAWMEKLRRLAGNDSEVRRLG
uniref:DUF4276 family protein n=1 Tax=Candidatus Kentrum sp. DK TaxID=2126562 RepID=A0A450S6P6_9GAMM|nr:MAG: protein of unknown function (DUF4276) [Candidatus Kentron sp. DK]